jgi:hypothetical protein
VVRYSAGRSFLDIIGPSDIAYIVSIIKNSKGMWDQDIRMQELGAEAMGNPEKKFNHCLQVEVTRRELKVRVCGI